MKLLPNKITKELIDIASKTLFQDRISLNIVEDKYFNNYNYTVTKDKNFISKTSLPFSFYKINVEDFNNLYNFSYCLDCNNTTHIKNFPTGNLKPRYFVTGIAPGCANVKSFCDDRIFSYGKTSDYLRYALVKLNIHQHSWYTNIIKCSVRDNRNVSSVEADNCKVYFLNDIMLFKPTVAIVLGAEAKYYFSKYYKKYFKEYYFCKHPSSFMRTKNIESY